MERLTAGNWAFFPSRVCFASYFILPILLWSEDKDVFSRENWSPALSISARFLVSPRSSDKKFLLLLYTSNSSSPLWAHSKTFGTCLYNLFPVFFFRSYLILVVYGRQTIASLTCQYLLNLCCISLLIVHQGHLHTAEQDLTAPIVGLTGPWKLNLHFIHWQYKS